MAGIYIHIPFCKQACFYCDFHFSTNLQRKTEMVAAICKELEMQKSYFGQSVISSIYFGGGTPSLLDDSELKSILTTVRTNFTVAENAEITLEANPDDLSFGTLQRLFQRGINRLSIGIQSFDDQQLIFLNRAHTGQEALKCIGEARDTGFDNISLDLIYAIPSPDHTLWRKSWKPHSLLVPNIFPLIVLR